MRPHLRLRAHPRLVAHAVLVVLLAMVGIAIFGITHRTPPFDRDNLIGLSIGEVHTPASILSAESTTSIPSFRPFSRLAVWIQYQLVGPAAGSYFVVNGAIWFGVAVAVYAVVHLLIGSFTLAFLAGVFVLSDWRAQEALFWVGERQSSLAVFLGTVGLVAGYLVVRRPLASPRRRLLEGTAIGLLLLAAALSKEYGLAFAGGVAALGVLHLPRREARDLVVVGFTALGAYVALRLALAGGAVASDYCDEAVGYFGRHLAEVCSEDRTVLLAGYLVSATFIGTFFPMLLEDQGLLMPASAPDFQTALLPLFMSALLTALAVIAWVRMPRKTLPLLAVIVGNAILSFLIYRTRNQLAGGVSLYASAAVGTCIVCRALVPHIISAGSMPRRGLALVGIAGLLGAAGGAAVVRGSNLHDRLVTYQQNAREANPNPCTRYNEARTTDGLGPELSTEVIVEVARRWGVGSPGCAQEAGAGNADRE